VRGGGIDILVPQYLYLVFLEIEGYLKLGAWKPEPGMVVIDVGGCAGEFAYYAAKCVAHGRVIMLEPDPANLAEAQAFFDSQGGKPTNLEVMQIGLHEKPGTLHFSSGMGACSRMAEIDGTTGNTLVQVESLGSLAERLHLDRIDLVKMDIEGAEIEAVRGAADAIERYKPKFAIASYHLRDGQQTQVTIESMFRQFGYTVDTGFPAHQTTYAAPK